MPTTAGVFVVHGNFLSIELLSIDSAGTTGTVVDLVGEAPGHLHRPYDVDVTSDGTMLALLSAMPGRIAVRKPVWSPFEHTETIEPFFDEPGIASGMGVRVVDGAVISHLYCALAHRTHCSWRSALPLATPGVPWLLVERALARIRMSLHRPPRRTGS